MRSLQAFSPRTVSDSPVTQPFGPVTSSRHIIAGQQLRRLRRTTYFVLPSAEERAT